MDLLDIGKKIVGMGLPILGGILGGPAGGIAASMIGHVLGLGSKPTAEQISAAIDQDPASAKLALQKLQDEHAEELAWIAAQQAQAAQTGQTMRVEYGSGDPYVRRWRPTWGYVTAGGWLLEALAVFVAVIGATVLTVEGDAGGGAKLLSGMTTLTYALSALWTIALAVLGVNIVQRSKDKQTQAGASAAPGLLSKLAGLLPGGTKPASPL